MPQTAGPPATPVSTPVTRLRARLSLPPNQIAVGQSLRAVLALSVPLALLSAVGHPVAGLLWVVGALQVVLADGSGPYRDRLLSMLLVSFLVPEIYWLGTQTAAPWWAAAMLVFALSFLGGLMRAIGPRGALLGLVSTVSYLLGTLTAAPAMTALAHTGWFFVGCLWTFLLAVASWRLRPYLSLQRETGTALDSAARLLAAVSAGNEHPRDLERDARAAVETARAALDATRAMVPTNNTTLTRLFVVVRVASRLAAFAMGLTEIRTALATDPELRRDFDATVTSLAANVREAARALMESRAWRPTSGLAAARERLRNGAADHPDADQAQTAALGVLGKSGLYINELAEVCAFFAGPRRHDRWLPRLALRERLHEMGHLVMQQVADRTTLFRHALRLGVVAAVATAIELYWGFPHGMWLPLTVLVVMQPDFGATRGRALIRAAGTLAGVLIAAAVLALTSDDVILQAALALFVFLTTFMVRVSYGFFVACLTPLIIILLAMHAPGQGWHFAEQRILETLGGIALSIAGALLLWPDWISHRLPATFARSVMATGLYLEAVFQAAATGAGLTPQVAAARREAERAVADGELAFQTLVAEPGHRSRRARYRLFELQLARLLRYLGGLTARLDTGLEPVPGLGELGADGKARLTAAARALKNGTPVDVAREPLPVRLQAAPSDVRELAVAVNDAVDELVGALQDVPAGTPAEQQQ